MRDSYSQTPHGQSVDSQYHVKNDEYLVHVVIHIIQTNRIRTQGWCLEWVSSSDLALYTVYWS
jgi:hypothetical protein